VTSDGGILNDDVFKRDNNFDLGIYASSNGLRSNSSLEDLTFRPDSDYPDWYIEHLKKVRNGTYGSENEPSTPAQSVDYEDHCADQTVYTSFDYEHANTNILDFCKGGADLLVSAAPLWNTYDHTHDLGIALHLGI
jgi:hypothetical protein